MIYRNLYQQHCARLLACLAMSLSALLTSPVAFAQAKGWPDKPVKLYVGFPPGGGSDAIARIIAINLSQMWGQQVIIDNRGGAAGTIAADLVAKSPADGYTLGLAHVNALSIIPALGQKMSYNASTDFTPIVLLGITPNILIANIDAPAKNVKDLVAYMKQNPGKVSFGSAGNGSTQHLAYELFMHMAGTEALHIPYKGSGPVLVDLIAGHITYAFETMGAATPHIQSGKVIPLAQTRTKRSPAYPNVPTMEQLGYVGFEATAWYGLMGPAKLDPKIVEKINADVNTILRKPEIQAKLNEVGAEDGGGTPAAFSKFILKDRNQWAKLVKDAKLQVDLN
ncbi:tripartite tricarboxylate transporter substrate binding protein [Polynucleobacter sp. MG-6-Vaara-E2]|jgi:tripartite-type tricarboxylate transporter receptor subunit TctC|uniref:Bug family tripartite tricarboxylate transporter substrate binding protein n=1 Tax=Polynucleobacter sp. MG-6-Vaara-E2 TaxID=2576932 RepID=UPI00203F3D95|nr:tripartite tricarboxylate transporter substrate binding protein [Polynucleobacter sp. MG-6-Vaara-E2]